MLKARNVIIILVINYMFMIFVSAIVELHAIANKAKELQSLIRTAGDMALEQSQLVDEVMAYGGRESAKIIMPSADGNGFVQEDLFAGVFGLDSSVDTNGEKIFNKLYNNNDFKMLASRTSAIKRPVKYWNATKTGFDWYYIPTIAMMGLDILPNDEYPNAIRGVKDSAGRYVDESLANEILSAYDLDSHVKESGGKQYYNTPLNIGITYINEDLLSTLFINNLDMLMRYKYEENLNTEKGGNGILKGETYSNKIKGDLSKYNSINNGSFTILRGTQKMTSPRVKAFEGVKPTIVYKVIDMYDSKNDPLLIALFGAEKGGYPTKAEYLKSLDQDVINPATGQPYTSKPIVVARVTFYVDVIIPYFTLIARELRGSLGEGDNNFLEIVPEKPGGVEGTRRIAYTRYFAVIP